MPISEQAARANLEALIAKYNAQSNETLETMTEASVVRQFIDILLRDVLGWPIEDPERYKYELRTGAGRPDITLFPERGGNIFVEAKKFGVIKQLEQARYTTSGIVTPGQLALPGMTTDRTLEEQQAINYAFENDGTWAILTNFQRLRLFNARRDWLVLSFEQPTAYLEQFDLLWQLSYDNILNGSLDRLSEQRHRQEVDTEYLQFINEWRQRLAGDILAHPDKNPWAFAGDTINLPVLRSVVQQFLDRLVVIRFAEDHLVLPPDTLRSVYEIRRNNIYTFSMDEFIDRIFQRFDAEHNSSLFAHGTVDEAVFSDDVLLPLMAKLYEARYRAMPADILGNTYEQYLGKTLAYEDGSITTRDNLETRKKQGSYYTPQVIVRHIVDNSLGRYLYGTSNGKPDGDPIEGETRKTSADIRDLRVLDSACGSGSFLIYAYYVLADFYQSEMRRMNAAMSAEVRRLAAEGTSQLDIQIAVAATEAEVQRIQNYPRLILENHLYGVDLDPQAAEIAVVNLIMRAMERKGTKVNQRLPLILNQNVKVGNSLIGLRADDPRLREHQEALAQIRALRLELIGTPNDNPRHQQIIEELTSLSQEVRDVLNADLDARFSDLGRIRPFHWGLEFPEAFYDAQGQPLANPGFQVIIGNPPYGGYLTANERSYLNDLHQLGTTDTAALFMAQSMHLTCSNGFNSFIVPKSMTYSSRWVQIRQAVLPGLLSLVDCGKVWRDVNLEQSIYIWMNSAQPDAYTSLIFESEAYELLGDISKQDVRDFGLYLNGVTTEEVSISHQVRSSAIFLGQVFSNTRGAGLQAQINADAQIGAEVIGGRQVQPFHVAGSQGRIITSEETPTNAFVIHNSVLAQNIVSHVRNPVDHIKITACVVPESSVGSLILDTVNQLVSESKLSPFFVVGLLQSELINWYVYRFIYGKAIRTMHFDDPVTDRIPLPILNLNNPQSNTHYQRIVDLVERIAPIAAQDIASAKQLIAEMNEEIYSLYGIDARSKAIVKAKMP